MPLTGDPAKDIPELQAAGHPHRQAIAIALKEQREKRHDAEAMPVAAPEMPIAPGAGAAGRAAGIAFLGKDGRMLFMHRGDGGDYPGVWAFPGGHQEPGESLEETARREAHEETGFAYDGPLTCLHDDGQFCTYLARIDEPFPVTLCDESTGYTWGATPPEPVHPGMADTLRVLAADTELACAELIRDGVLPSPYWFERSGARVFLVALRITGTGTAYRSKLKEHVYRDPELYLNDAFLRRCNGLFVVYEHPAKKVIDPKEFDKRISGAIMLPYLQGDEAWGIARLGAQDAIDWVTAAAEDGKPISTSPGVVFDENSGNVKVALESGKLLIEGKPALIDHLAICALGVWDKNGPAAGVEVTNSDIEAKEEMAMADDDRKDDSKHDDDSKKDDSRHRKDDSKKYDDAEMKAACDAAVADAMKRRDDDDAKRKADAEESERKDKARKDSEREEEERKDKARKDAEETEKREEEEARKDAEEGALMADSQARADSVFSMLGDRAPAPLRGENVQRYRRRLANKLKVHSPVYGKINLDSYTDDAAFTVAESHIYADATEAAKRPIGADTGRLVARESLGPGGHRITEYHGDPMIWMRRWMSNPESVSFPKEVLGYSLK